jgi:GTP pyrophosphokinase
MNNVRDILENAESGPMQLMRDIKTDIYSHEVFAFTPKGDLLRLPADSTVLDFAFSIHSNVGCRCTGAIVDGRHQKINYKIHNGDTIEIQTSSTQTPKQDWLNIVVTAKARNKIKQTLNEVKIQRAEIGKELLERRARNRKIEIEEAILMKLIKKSGYKFAKDFFADLGEEKIDVSKFLTNYQQQIESESETVRISAEDYRITPTEESAETKSTEVLTIGEKSIKGLNYKLARCCNPIHGDEVFGFISSDGVVKVHKNECPNATNIRQRYPYRLINVRWSGGVAGQFPVTLRIVGQDDIGIVTNITSIIAKEEGMSLRNISIDSHDGIFQGYLILNVRDTQQLSQLLRKLRTVKGVKDASRS